MILLGVNIDHAATLREARYRGASGQGGCVEPDPVTVALLSEQAGADGITVHLREDRRHIQEHDVRRLREVVATRLNLEMACTPEMIAYALSLKPEAVCVVPENRTEITTEGGLNVVVHRARVQACVDAMNAAGIATSLFIDPDPAQVELAAELRAPVIELHTGAYANATGPARAKELARLIAAARLAAQAGLTVNAGHGINYVNIAEVRTIPHLHELNIGHAILSRSVLTDIGEAVREMKARMNP